MAITTGVYEQDGSLRVSVVGNTATPTGTQSVSITNPTAVSDGNNVSTTHTNRSSTVTLGGTSQTLMAANAARKGFRIQNLSTSALYFNDLGSAAVTTGLGSSFTLPPLSVFESTGPGCSNALVAIIGATTGQAFAAREW